MPVWWRDEDNRPLNEPVYTLTTGWATFNWSAVFNFNSPKVRVDLIPIPGQKGRSSLYATATIMLSNDETETAKDLGVRLLSSIELLDMMLRIAGLRYTPLIKEPFSGGLLDSTFKDGRRRFSEEALVTRYNIYKDGIKSADPVVFARILNDLFERTRQQRSKAMQEIEFETRLFQDIVNETKMVLDVSEDRARTAVARRVGFDPATLVRRRVRKEK